MLKDRKFWTGFLAGALLLGGVAFVQPMMAAGQAGQADPQMKQALMIMLEMAKMQKQMGTDLTAVKNNTDAMKTTLEQLKGQGGLTGK